MKIIIIFAFCFIFLAYPVSHPKAVVNPNASPNNKFGIHIIDENDLYAAAKLVNSNGGDWGYITMVLTYDDRKLEKWQRTFDLMNNWHLIPIIRLATRLSGDTWEKPILTQAKDWSEFLSKLHWPIKNRYLVLFNEPNHAKEWGGSIDPIEYGKIVVEYSKELKNKSLDFYILPAGLDASAPNSKETMDEISFIKEISQANPEFFSSIDGWTSHSYPNPGFRGKVSDLGRGTLRTYIWEMEILKSLNQKSDYPIFITETGWPHKEGTYTNNFYYSENEISNLIIETANIIWRDPKIVALTPFVLNYQSYPFENFSWKKKNSDKFYAHYDSYKNLPKNAGNPQLSLVFEKFEGLKIENLSDKSDMKLKGVFDGQIFKGKLRSLFYMLFKL